ncbi:MAG: coenzyme F420-0:L-glutamate ligase [Christensenellales bacterium]
MGELGTISYGIRTPIIKRGDNLVEIVTRSVLSACEENNIILEDKDIVGVTEAVVGISQSNFATVDQITKDVERHFKNKVVGLIFPILSRNRFSLILKAISKACKKLIIMLSYPSDEVGNPLITQQALYDSKINPYGEALTETQFHELFGSTKHLFTGVDYIKFYKEIAGENCEIIFGNKAENILAFTKYIINADIHTRKQTKKHLYECGAKKVVSLDELMTKSIDGSGFNKEYGLLGSNINTDDTLKLFPRETKTFVDNLQKEFYRLTGKTVECLVYGDGAFKDPVGKIWELADPVVSPAYTSGLSGTPNEIKLKYVSETQLSNLSGKEASEEFKKILKQKQGNSKDNKRTALGTTPRQISDLVGSLCDLTSGSGDKGTPVILIKNYFKNYAD